MTKKRALLLLLDRGSGRLRYCDDSRKLLVCRHVNAGMCI